MIITIDGYSCQGKTYIGKALAKEFGIEFLSTGKIVRYVAFQYTKLYDKKVNVNLRLEKAVQIMKKTEMQKIIDCNYLDSKETEIAMKIVSEYPYVFDEAVKRIISYARGKDIVMDGRFTFKFIPTANKCYYFKSSLQRRAKLLVKAKNMSYDDAIAYIKFRDSFEKEYKILEYVEIIYLDSFKDTTELIKYLKNNILK